MSFDNTDDFIKKEFEHRFFEYEKQLQDSKQRIDDSFFQIFTNEIIIPNKEKIPHLYRYSTADYYSIRNLETQTLKLSNIGNMNDVFEGLSGEVDDNIINSMSELNDLAYIKSFTENKNDIVMWSHYGDDCAGMCVEYDFSQLGENVLYHLFPVVYSDKRNNLKILGNAVNELYELKKANKEDYYPDLYKSLLDIMSLYIKKSESWKEEKEWRIVATYPQIHNSPQDFYDIGKNEIVPIYLLNSEIISVRNCIKAVYTGPRIENEKKEHIKQICSINNIEFHEMVISKTEYTFEEKTV